MAPTKTRPASRPAQTQQPKPAQEVAVIGPPRLAYLPALKDQFEIDEIGWRTLVDSIFPGAKTVGAVRLALDYCKRRDLDVFKRVVHIVPIWSASARNGQGGMVETVWPGIAELRTTASRTKNYAGMDTPEFGEMVEETFTGRVKKGDKMEDVTVTVAYPEWCRITVYRIVQGHRVGFVGPTCYWREYYGKRTFTDLPNDRWEKAPSYQIEKCAEAGALRRAFPEEIGNDLAMEEAGAWHEDPVDVTGQGSATTTGEVPAEPKAEDFAEEKPKPTEAKRTDWLATGTSVKEVEQKIYDLIEKAQTPEDVFQIRDQNATHGKAMKGPMWKAIEDSCDRLVTWMNDNAAKERV